MCPGMKFWRGDDRTPVVVLGAGGTGLYMTDRISAVDGCRFAGFLDDDASKQANGYEGQPVVGAVMSWRQLDARTRFVSSLYGAKKMDQFQALVQSLGIPRERWATVVDPRAV